MGKRIKLQSERCIFYFEHSETWRNPGLDGKNFQIKGINFEILMLRDIVII